MRTFRGGDSGVVDCLTIWARSMGEFPLILARGEDPRATGGDSGTNSTTDGEGMWHVTRQQLIWWLEDCVCIKDGIFGKGNGGVVRALVHIDSSDWLAAFSLMTATTHRSW